MSFFPYLSHLFLLLLFVSLVIFFFCFCFFVYFASYLLSFVFFMHICFLRSSPPFFTIIFISLPRALVSVEQPIRSLPPFLLEHGASPVDRSRWGTHIFSSTDHSRQGVWQNHDQNCHGTNVLLVLMGLTCLMLDWFDVFDA